MTIAAKSEARSAETTLAELAKTSIPEDWHHDGISFAPSILNKEGPKRAWSFFWYDPRPGWDKERFPRHIFALDYNYKLFADGRFFDISGEGFKEQRLGVNLLTSDAKNAKDKLQKAIDQNMRGPMSEAALTEVDAFGNLIE